MDQEWHPCPICEVPVNHQVRYPRAICGDCINKSKTSEGQKIGFSNISIDGGFIAVLKDTGEVTSDHICYIDGNECWADEARFGGIVIQPHDGQTHDGQPYGLLG